MACSAWSKYTPVTRMYDHEHRNVPYYQFTCKVCKKFFDDIGASDYSHYDADCTSGCFSDSTEPLRYSFHTLCKECFTKQFSIISAKLICAYEQCRSCHQLTTIKN